MKKILLTLLFALSWPLLALASDITVTAANVAIVSGTSTQGTAGETLTAGQPVYLKSTDSKLYKAKADTAAHAAILGITLNGAAAGQPVGYLKSGFTLNPGATLVVGTTYVVSSANAGGIAPIADLGSGAFSTIIGTATTSSNLPLRFIVSGVAKP